MGEIAVRAEVFLVGLRLVFLPSVACCCCCCFCEASSEQDRKEGVHPLAPPPDRSSLQPSLSLTVPPTKHNHDRQLRQSPQKAGTGYRTHRIHRRENHKP